MLTLHKEINQQNMPQSNGNVINLSKKQEDEFIDCFSYKHFINKTNAIKRTKKLIIKYVKMFIGNKMSYELCNILCNVARYDDLFKIERITIKNDLYLIFYIDDFMYLVSVADVADDPWSIGHYNNVTELNGYTIAYDIHEQFVIDTIAYPENDTEYISFILYKDDMIYIIEDCCCKKELDTLISNVTNKNINLTNEQIKDCLNSLFVLNTLKK